MRKTQKTTIPPGHRKLQAHTDGYRIWITGDGLPENGFCVLYTDLEALEMKNAFKRIEKEFNNSLVKMLKEMNLYGQ